MTTSSGFPTFSEFFAAVHGFEPHAWQADLARSVQETGQWPWTLAVPTGLGKTSAIDVAVYELARQCHEDSRRTAPQRIFHVVDRRRIIDSTAAHAAHLAACINDPTTDVLRAVHDSLAPLRSAGNELVVTVSSIHGERPDDRVWMQATGCSVISLTSHQYVSRLLLRGYGVSPGTRSIAAGLCGIDALVLFDEPHLSSQSIHTILRVQELQARAPEDLGVPPLQMALLGATVPPALADLQGSDRGRLAIDSASERGHAAVERLAARRTAFVQWVKPTDGEIRNALVAAAKEAWKRNARRVIVFANTVEIAQAVYSGLARRRKAGASPLMLLTSHFRPFDRTGLDSELLEGPCTVVATQTLEVGVDVTFDELITEAPSWASLKQRLGRLNRDGTSNEHGRATVVAGWNDASAEAVVRKGSAAVYGERTVGAATRLLHSQDDLTARQGIDMGFDGLRAIEMSDLFDAEALEAEPARIGTLTSSHLPLLAQTRPVPDPDIPVDALISGPDTEHAREIAVAWRDELSVFDDPSSPRVDPSEYVTIRRDLFDVFLRSLQWNPLGGSDREQIRIWDPRQERWAIPGSRFEASEASQIILSSSLGGYTPELGWTGARNDAGGLDISTDALIRMLTASAGGPVSSSADLVITHSLWLRLTDDGDARRIEGVDTNGLSDVLATLGSRSSGGADDDETLEALEDAAQDLAENVAEYCGLDINSDRLQILQSSNQAVVVRFAQDIKARTSEEQTLDLHRRQVAAWADADATAVGLPQPIIDMLLEAGLCHDDGKLRPEWQAYIGADDVPLARSSRRRAAQVEAARWKACGLEDGWRHEADSVRRLETAPSLLGHLVGSHHGWYRPILPPVRTSGGGIPEYPRVLGHADQFAELNTRFGVWGLSYLEAVLRLADWNAAAKAEECRPRDISGSSHKSDPAIHGPLGGHPEVRRLDGLRTHPLTGWHAATGLLIAAHIADPAATIHWEPFGGPGAAPIIPVLTTTAPLDELVSQILHDPQWNKAQALATSHGLSNMGFGVKYQKLEPAACLHGLLLDADDAEVGLAAGVASDLAATETKGAIPMPIVPFANMASYPSVALKMVAGNNTPSHSDIHDVCAALLSEAKGFSDEKCDGGMDRPEAVKPGINGLGSPETRQTRSVLAPLAMYGIGLLGSGPVRGLGVTRSGKLVLPLPTTPVTLNELRAMTYVGAVHPRWPWAVDGLDWVYSAEKKKVPAAGDKVFQWLGGPRSRRASEV
ncbi:type I-G CRISPR-associated helicase/endonuclease Cas3g [Acidipropionibacterium virtanenii]|uniref:HD Cas3-type domain-containing protein n=1 Tax=Acidipropionibacterium virtanenii TaxID=2057246 RepID=A0A344USS0_9ACTN|nr:hypothetical protein [Acidipropionibacterium virtanenii]AXE38318.1 hypothetical protein JS278_01138 [Acidipropionibacterium virtanenii]